MAAITKTHREIAFTIKRAAKKAKIAKAKNKNAKPFSKDEIIEKYFREKAQPKKVSCFARNFY